MADGDIDIDIATVEVIRANDTELRRLQAEIAAASGDEERELIIAFIERVKRQEGVLSEVPGMEERAHHLRTIRIQAEEHYGLGGTS